MILFSVQMQIAEFWVMRERWSIYVCETLVLSNQVNARVSLVVEKLQLLFVQDQHLHL